MGLLSRRTARLFLFGNGRAAGTGLRAKTVFEVAARALRRRELVAVFMVRSSLSGVLRPRFYRVALHTVHDHPVWRGPCHTRVIGMSSLCAIPQGSGVRNGKPLRDT
jgi:hypothetical protein